MSRRMRLVGKPLSRREEGQREKKPLLLLQQLFLSFRERNRKDILHCTLGLKVEKTKRTTISVWKR